MRGLKRNALESKRLKIPGFKDLNKKLIKIYTLFRDHKWGGDLF